MSEKDSNQFPLFSILDNFRTALKRNRRKDKTENAPADKDADEKNGGNQNARSALKTIAVLGAGTLAITGSVGLYQKIFSRFERPDYSLTPGLCVYERMSDRLERKEIFYPSGDTMLAGYYYPAENAKGLVVFAHGFRSGADDYLAIFEYMAKNRFSVFAFDVKGTYDSGGDSTVGLAQALVDLDATLTYLKSQPEFKDYPMYLLGHSCGGYAVTAVLSLHRDIRACAAIAPMNCASAMILEKGELYTCLLPSDILTDLPAAFLVPYQKYLFGKYSSMTAVEGINSTDIPVLIAHGNRDRTVDFNMPLSVIGQRLRIRSDNVFYYIGKDEQSGHDTIWRGKDAVRYREETERRYKELTRGRELSYAEQQAFYTGVDHERYGAINEELFMRVVDLFDTAP